jgi:acetyltransferase
MRSALAGEPRAAYGDAMDLRIRRARPTDAAALERFYAELSDESRRTRFFGYARGISPDQSRSFCSVDHRHREGFVAIDRAHRASPDRIVGHLCIEPSGRTSAEVAIAVADAYQHHGIGHRLMVAGIDWARAVGIRQLTATTLETNGPIRRLITGLGLTIATRPCGPDSAEITIDLERPLLEAA